MKTPFSLLCLLTFASITFCELIPWPPKERYLVQTLDHFNFISIDRKYVTHFKQRYLYEDKWYKPGGPIFFYCGNEGPIDATWNHTGLMFELAPKLNALVLFGEHRYYGKTVPFGPIKSFKQPYIQFLSVEQAMADYVYLITTVKSMFNATKAPVIAFGGSYGGCLAAYMRFKYPNIILGSLAASAPIGWVAGIGRFHQFFEIITNDVKEVNSQCVSIVKAGFQQMENYSTQGLPGYKIISKDLKTCNVLTSKASVEYAMKWIRNAFVMLAMTNFPYPRFSHLQTPAYPVRVACEALLANSRNPIVALREAAAVYYGVKDCYDPTQLYIECADITGCGLGPDSKAWDFQSCTEMHLYDDSNTTKLDMFPSLPLTLSYVTKYCQKMWEVDRAPDQLKLLQWGIDVRAVTNVIFSNGDMDPWSKGGIMSNETLSPSSVALIVKGGAHCYDLWGSNPADSPSVKSVRAIEENWIRNWLISN